MSILADSGDLIIKSTEGTTTIKSPLRGEITDVSGLVNILLKFLFPVAIVIFLCMMIYAGFQLLTSEGQPDKIKSVQGIIYSSLIGLFLLFVAFLVVRIVAHVFGFGGGILGI